VAKGAATGLFFRSDDVRATFEELKSRGVEFQQKPTEQPDGIDAGFRDHEVIIVLEGQATLDDGQAQQVVSAGDIVVIPAGRPHGFVNSGEGRLRQVDIHAIAHFVTEWLDAPG
jgi:mannose-6-phosphate isomerase-like protein (cupin superfamily)